MALGSRLIPAHAGKTRPRRRACRAPAAHPRSRGENARRGGPITSAPGSSPLTRGKLVSRSQANEVFRLIPAHAGKTSDVKLTPLTPSAHPRSRGENSTARVGRRTFGGSSPLTRGKLYLLPPGSLPSRLIPAHAGKTSAGSSILASQSAHPRSRGENLRNALCIVTKEGSSPLTRGKRQLCVCVRVRKRLIPAHAGKTAVDYVLADIQGAHPRSRGENVSSASYHGL